MKKSEWIGKIAIFAGVVVFAELAYAHSQQASKKVSGEQKVSALVKPADLKIIEKSYPDVKFTTVWSTEKNDWRVDMEVDGRTGNFWWCEGRLLPENELVNADKYWPMVTNYPDKVADPNDFTEDDIKRIREYSSPENRKNGAKSTPFFYDVLYDCKTQKAIEKHIVTFTFLGKYVNAHEKLVEPMGRVEKRINELAKKDKETKNFVDQLSSVQSYSWREISDSKNRSFHSMGVAVDVLPKGWGKKNLYWAWRRDIDKDNWMKLPLDRRWMPPEKVIKAFEDEGFIWGGKWIIWDNMHFEYHPEQIMKSRQ